MTIRRACCLVILVSGLQLAEGVAHAQCPAAALAAVPPAITLDTTPGAPEFYFRENGGTQSLLLGRNPAGWDLDGSAGVDTQHFDELFGYAAAGNERIMRIHVTVGAMPHPLVAGDVHCDWVYYWDEVLTRAANQGLHVLPVFGIHGQWRAALPNWATNEYNVALGKTCLDGTMDCLTADPGDLLRPTATRDAWIAWVRTVVARWKDRPNIMGWEIFSEVDLIDGATDADATSFIEAAKLEIRAEDPYRPVTASLSGTIDWPLVNNSTIDFIQLHPYSSTFGPGNLDEMLLSFVPGRRLAYPTKPLFIGESGLHYLSPDNAGNLYTLDEPGARTGIRQAIWAGAVSGAMNARMLWWEDGYDRFHIDDLCVLDGSGAPVYPQYAAYVECTDGDTATKLTLRALYANAAAPVAAFVQGVDYAGFAPVGLTSASGNLFGAALGGTSVVLGWVKDVDSVEATNWTVAGALSGETVTLNVPGSSADWLVEFYDTETGALLPLETIDADEDPITGDITFALPGFTGSIAFKVTAVGPLDADINIIPADNQNRINISTPGAIPVAIFPTPDLDVTDIDVTSVRFGPPGAPGAQYRSYSFVDSNGDGIVDYLRMRFRKVDAGFSCGDTVGELTGETLTGRSIYGSQPVIIRRFPPC
jgi:hypothetical protein